MRQRSLSPTKQLPQNAHDGARNGHRGASIRRASDLLGQLLHNCCASGLLLGQAHVMGLYDMPPQRDFERVNAIKRLKGSRSRDAVLSTLRSLEPARNATLHWSSCLGDDPTRYDGRNTMVSVQDSMLGYLLYQSGYLDVVH